MTPDDNAARTPRSRPAARGLTARRLTSRLGASWPIPSCAIIALPLSVLVAGAVIADQPASDASEIVATVDADSITAAQVTAQAERMLARDNEDPIAYRHRLLEPLIHRLLLKAEAERLGMFAAPEVLEGLEQAETAELRRLLTEAHGGDREAVDGAVLSEFGVEFNAEVLRQLTNAITYFETKDATAFSQPLVEAGSIDSTLVLYRTGDQLYTVADFLAGPGARRTIYTGQWTHDPERLQKDLSRTYIDRTAARLARRQGLDQTADFRRWSASRHEQLAVTRLYEVAVVEATRPSDGELRAYYEANQEGFRLPDVASTESWAFTDSVTARRIERALRQGLPDATVNSLARNSGHYDGERQLQTPLDVLVQTAGHKPAPGEIVCVVKGRTSWVHRIVEILEDRVSPFESISRQVRREVEEQRAEEKLKELLDDTRTRVIVTVHDAALARVPI